MEGNPVGMPFDDAFGGDFVGVGNDSYGMMDQEILMGRNAWLNGDPFAKQEEPGMPGPDMDPFDNVE